MSEALYREFRIRNEGAMRVLWQFFKLNAKAFIETGRTLLVIVTDDEQKRTALQNRRYWKAVLEQISSQVWVEGKRFDKDTWHEYFAERHCPRIEFVMPMTGEIFSRRKSTSEMTVREFAEYMQTVEAEASAELGVVFYVQEAA